MVSIRSTRAAATDRVHPELLRPGRRKIDPVDIGFPPETREGQGIRNIVVFESVGTKTEMTVTEQIYESDQAYAISKMGLEQCLDKMAASSA